MVSRYPVARDLPYTGERGWSTEGRLHLSLGVCSQPGACLPSGGEHAEREAASPGCAEAGCSGEGGLCACPCPFRLSPLAGGLFTCLVQGPGVLTLLASIMLPSGPDFQASGSEWLCGGRPQILEMVASVALASIPCLACCFLSPTPLMLPASHLLLTGPAGGYSLFLCPRKPQPPTSTWKKPRKLTHTCWRRSSSCEGPSMT